MLEIVAAIIGCITGLFGLVISLFSIHHNKTVAVHEFLSKMESDEFITARRAVYNRPNNAECDLQDKDASLVVNIFHHWGLLARRRYLPMWVFDGASGSGACRLYEKLEPYIQKRRDHHRDNNYAEHFEWLYKKLKRKQLR